MTRILIFDETGCISHTCEKCIHPTIVSPATADQGLYKICERVYLYAYCLYVDVCVKERERERKRVREKYTERNMLKLAVIIGENEIRIQILKEAVFTPFCADAIFKDINPFLCQETFER